MPLPPSPLLIAGWRTTTPFTRIPGWATAHPANTSCCLNPPPVRFNGVNSTHPLRLESVATPRSLAIAELVADAQKLLAPNKIERCRLISPASAVPKHGGDPCLAIVPTWILTGPDWVVRLEC